MCVHVLDFVCGLVCLCVDVCACEPVNKHELPLTSDPVAVICFFMGRSVLASSETLLASSETSYLLTGGQKQRQGAFSEAPNATLLIHRVLPQYLTGFKCSPNTRVIGLRQGGDQRV